MNISISIDIASLSAFKKRSSEFIKRLKDRRQPIILTQHGKSAAVLVDVAEFEKIIRKMDMLEDVPEARLQIEQGKTHTMQEARERMEKHISRWK